MKIDAAHQNPWEIAEVIFGLPFLASLFLHFLVPLALPPGGLRQALLFIGITLVVLGLSLLSLARREFARYGQPTGPGLPTSRVVTSGIFALSRNPLYLAGICVLLGLALALNILWALAGLLIAVILCHYLLILPEERYLAQKFGEEYHAYSATVGRWLGRRG